MPVDNEYEHVKAENDWTAQQTAEYPDRLRAFYSLNPLKSYALEELPRCSKDPQLHYGLKLQRVPAPRCTVPSAAADAQGLGGSQPVSVVAKLFSKAIGSWRFLIVQSSLLAIWIALNITAYAYHWDPYPFILLNLAMSFQAAYAAPILMMSQNRQAEKDHLQARNDYDVNLKAELEIMQLHEKFDSLRDSSWVELVRMQQQQIEMLERLLMTENRIPKP